MHDKILNKFVNNATNLTKLIMTIIVGYSLETIKVSEYDQLQWFLANRRGTVSYQRTSMCLYSLFVYELYFTEEDCIGQ